MAAAEPEVIVETGDRVGVEVDVMAAVSLRQRDGTGGSRAGELREREVTMEDILDS